jgi:hypothetical protein
VTVLRRAVPRGDLTVVTYVGLIGVCAAAAVRWRLLAAAGLGVAAVLAHALVAAVLDRGGPGPEPWSRLRQAARGWIALALVASLTLLALALLAR